MLDLELAALLGQSRAAGAPDLCDLPPMAARGLYQALLAAADQAPAEVAMEQRLIDGPGGSLALRIYRPNHGDSATGAVLYLHGGGFVVGDLNCYHAVCSNLCARSGALVVAVDYRLAPEHPFPAAVDDAYAALEWLAAEAAGLGADPRRLAVTGDSAGANLAAVTALLARDRKGPALAYQALIYPVTAPAPGQFPSHDKFGSGYVLTRRAMDYFNRLYFSPTAVAPDFRGAPLLAEDCAGLPPALIQVAGYDPLRDEGIAYAERLTAAGVPTTLVEYSGLAHGYLTMTGRLATARLAFDQLCSALGRQVGRTSAG